MAIFWTLVELLLLSWDAEGLNLLWDCRTCREKNQVSFVLPTHYRTCRKKIKFLCSAHTLQNMQEKNWVFSFRSHNHAALSGHEKINSCRTTQGTKDKPRRSSLGCVWDLAVVIKFYVNPCFSLPSLGKAGCWFSWEQGLVVGGFPTLQPCSFHWPLTLCHSKWKGVRKRQCKALWSV